MSNIGIAWIFMIAYLIVGFIVSYITYRLVDELEGSAGLAIIFAWPVLLLLVLLIIPVEILPKIYRSLDKVFFTRRREK